MPVMPEECTARQRPDQRVSGCCRVSPFAYTSASRGPHAPLGVVVDESDADQILAIDELRALRDRMGTEPAAPTAVTSAAPIQPPDQLAASLAARDDVWEDLRRQTRDRRKWGRFAAAGGCLALTGSAVVVLVITAHTRSVSPSGVVAPVPAVSAVPVSPAGPLSTAANGPVATSAPSMQPSAVIPLPGPAPSEVLSATAPAQPGTGPAQEATTQTAPGAAPQTVARHPAPPAHPRPRVTQNPPVDPPAPPAAQPPPDATGNADQQPQQVCTHWDPQNNRTQDQRC